MPVLRGINSNSIDLIYLDPPFNKGRNFHAPIGTSAEGASFHDIWSPDEVKDEWHNQINDRFPELYKYLNSVGEIGSRSAKYYLIYMAVRLVEMKRVLKETGSIFLHCDPTASHYLKLLLDTVFGHRNFRNEVVWCYTGNSTPKTRFQSKHDVVLFYAKKVEEIVFKPILAPYSEATLKRYNHVDADGRRYKMSTLRKGLEKVYAKEGKPIEDWWSDIPVVRKKSERLGYPTQKPLPLLERMIEASSNSGDIVLDPFCGCATTCVAAEKLDRQWIGIDVSEKAYDLVKDRLNREVPPDLFRGEPVFRKDIPFRTDVDYKKAPTKEDKKYLYGHQNGKCAACKTKFEIQHLEVDHIVPRSQGGGHEQENLQLLCSNCNRKKGDRPMEYLMARLRAA